MATRGSVTSLFTVGTLYTRWVRFFYEGKFTFLCLWLSNLCCLLFAYAFWLYFALYVSTDGNNIALSHCRYCPFVSYCVVLFLLTMSNELHMGCVCYVTVSLPLGFLPGIKCSLCLYTHTRNMTSLKSKS